MTVNWSITVKVRFIQIQVYSGILTVSKHVLICTQHATDISNLIEPVSTATLSSRIKVCEQPPWNGTSSVAGGTVVPLVFGYHFDLPQVSPGYESELFYHRTCIRF